LELHTSPLGGNSGFLKTYHRVKKEFFWDGLKLDIQKFVAECLVFPQNKVETINIPSFLQPLAIPSQCWEEVSMVLSLVFPSPKERQSSWWYFIDLPSMHIFVHYLIHVNPIQLLLH